MPVSLPANVDRGKPGACRVDWGSPLCATCSTAICYWKGPQIYDECYANRTLWYRQRRSPLIDVNPASLTLPTVPLESLNEDQGTENVMKPEPPGSLAAIIAALGHGLPLLIMQVITCAVLFAIGVNHLHQIDPFSRARADSRQQRRRRDPARRRDLGTAIPLAAMLATSVMLIDILVWGVVALILPLLTLGAVALGVRNFRDMIESGNIAAASTLAGAQIAVALLNAAAMVPQ
jgi:putative membrane protein